jgi:hypothetical protein
LKKMLQDKSVKYVEEVSKVLQMPTMTKGFKYDSN